MIDVDLSAKMEAALVARARGGPNANKPPSERKVPRASNLSQGCERLDFYYLTGADELPMDAMGAASTTNGQALEEDVLLDLEAALGLKFERQVPVETDWFKGTADAWNAEHKILADSKTANNASWSIKKREGTPGESYINQLNLYASVLGATKIIVPIRVVGKSAKDVVKDGPGVYLAFTFEPDPSVVARLRDGALRAMEAGHHTLIPPAPGYAKGHWLCKGYCSYRHLCPSGGT